MTTHGDEGKVVRYSEFLADAIICIRRNGQEKEEKSVKYVLTVCTALCDVVQAERCNMAR